jgi:hypothetical protein
MAGGILSYDDIRRVLATRGMAYDPKTNRIGIVNPWKPIKLDEAVALVPELSRDEIRAYARMQWTIEDTRYSAGSDHIPECPAE